MFLEDKIPDSVKEIFEEFYEGLNGKYGEDLESELKNILKYSKETREKLEEFMENSSEGKVKQNMGNIKESVALNTNGDVNFHNPIFNIGGKEEAPK
jgi:hypothetical protein